jgi:hypothetical protein
MAYTLKVIFRGLMMWVPAHPLRQRQPWFGAFLVEASPEAIDDQTKGDTTLRPHFPLVRFNLGDLQPGLPNPGGKGCWPLQHEDVVIVPASSPGRKLQVKYGRNYDPRPRKKQRDHFHWVPSLADLTGDGDVFPDCLEPQPDPSDPRVTARVHLREGVLGTDIPLFNKEDILVEFVPPIGTCRVSQVIATRVVLEMKGLGGDLTLRARSFRDGMERTLVLPDPGAGKTLEIEVLNLCPDELQGLSPGIPGEDHDFLWTYLPSKIWNWSPKVRQQLSRPVPVSLGFFGGGGGEYAHCTSQRANPLTPSQLATMMQVAGSV